MSSAHVELTDHKPLGQRVNRFVHLSRAVGLVGLGVAVALAIIGVKGGAAEGHEAHGGFSHFFRSYLTAFGFCLSISLGALFFTIVQHAVRAQWSVAIRRIAEILAANLPWMALLFVPVLVGLFNHLYHWTSPDPSDPHFAVIEHKAAYLNVPFFLIRTVIYFAVWTFLARKFYTQSVKQDETGDVGISVRLRALSPVGIILFALTTTFASFDWIMSLNPEWFSTIFGVYFFAGGMFGFFASCILIIFFLQGSGRLMNTVTNEHYQDLGKFNFAFTIFWSYIAFCQFMLIWYANIPEETGFFKVRQENGWENVSILLILGHFLLPFLALMSRHVKRKKGVLACMCCWVLFIHWIDMIWLVMPSSTNAPSLPLMEVACLVGVVGLYLSFTVGRMRSVNLVAQRDPLLKESLAFENF